MSRSREELRRGIRALIQDTRQRLEELEAGTAPSPPKPPLPRPEDFSPRPAEAPPAPEPEGPRLSNVRYLRPEPQPDEPPRWEVAQYDPRKGVCPAYFVNRRCWEVPDAYCNHALHVCMLRGCPVYHLYREELDRRFASRFKHLW